MSDYGMAKSAYRDGADENMADDTRPRLGRILDQIGKEITTADGCVDGLGDHLSPVLEAPRTVPPMAAEKIAQPDDLPAHLSHAVNLATRVHELAIRLTELDRRLRL